MPRGVFQWGGHNHHTEDSNVLLLQRVTVLRTLDKRTLFYNGVRR
jgi:hypothetical protein